MYKNLNVVPDIYTDGEENVGEEEGKKENWSEFFGDMEERQAGFKGMTVTVEQKMYNADEETDDEYPNVKQLEKKWLVFRDSKEALMNYWMGDLCKKYAKVDKEEHPSFWRNHLSTLADLYVVKDDAKAFVGQYGVLYRWEWRFSEFAISDCHTDSVTQAMYIGEIARKKAMSEMKESEQRNSYATLQKGWRYYLQILNTERKGNMGKWTDWIYLANSQYIEGNMGVFAARQFPAGMPVGFYIGPEVWRSSKVGGKYPNDK
jgi:hypothetical protein